MADYLSFSRRDRLAILIILLFVILGLLLPGLVSIKAVPKTFYSDTSWIASLRDLEQKEKKKDQAFASYSRDDNSYTYQYDLSKKNYQRGSKGSLFNFDPNSLPEGGWKKLGLREKTIHTILNYLSKGGRFRKQEDLQRVYGLFPDEYERLAPYIKIEETEEKARSNNYPVSPGPAKNPDAKTFSSRYQVIDINEADTSAFIALPGIGSKLAARIINFRDKLGGFYSISQVGETFGLPDSTFQKIKQWLKLENIFIRKININTATIDELKAHPYIRWNLANPIMAYRHEHGSFARVEDLKKVMALTEEIYQKILPYLSIEK